MANIYTPSQKAAKRQAIMTAAINLFAHRSYPEITMQQIAEAVGSSKGATFRYFTTKEDLFMTILLEDYQQYFTQLTTDLAQQPPLSADDFIAWMTTQTRQLIEEHSVLIRLNAIRGPILEGKANMQETITQREALYRTSQRLGQQLVIQTDHLLDQSQFSHLFIIQSGIISGLMNMAALTSFNHHKLSVNYPDFEIRLIPEAQQQIRYYLTQYLKEFSHK
ncbi:TetR/AcrR family transcriptional regulator [Lactiplantibacillus plantarum]|uniref:TetR/AcrR family transcriptional regulator n=1 Tax=Lactiplantibacillus plantarum TaxID=1590 RepID=UPI00217D6EAB|nr:TetR/AcrR family transcriptional regulator [Lactiplantibacillus plantarum]MCS6156959.1 TetR/AcrR family transcriptional regulator [Lactiplantibacillus plantarum]